MPRAFFRCAKHQEARCSVMVSGMLASKLQFVRPSPSFVEAAAALATLLALFSPVLCLLCFREVFMLTCTSALCVKALSWWLDGRVPSSKCGPAACSDELREPSRRLGEDVRYWIIKGKAYDLRPWRKQHPGGSYILDVTQGSDCTALFASYHALSTKDVDAMLKPFFVRDALPDEVFDSKLWDWTACEVYNDLKAVVRRYDALHGTKMLSSPAAVLAHLAMFAVWLSCVRVWWLGSEVFPSLTWGYCAAMVVLGFTHLRLVAGCAIHDGFHFAFARNASLNLGVGFALGMLHHLPGVWFRKHTICHHPYVNIEGKDPDLSHFNGWYAVRDGDASHWWYPLWPTVLPFVCLVHGWGTALWDTALVFLDVPVYGITRPGFPLRERLCLLVQTFLFAGVLVGGTARNGFLHTMFPVMVHSVLYYLGTEFQHIQKDSFAAVDTWKSVLAQEEKRPEWVVEQILNCQGDYCTEGRLWTRVLAGLNCQAMHHCFPTIHSWHFPFLAEEFQDVCERHGVVYRPHGSIWSSMFGYLRWIAEVNAFQGTWCKRRSPQKRQ